MWSVVQVHLELLLVALSLFSFTNLSLLFSISCWNMNSLRWVQVNLHLLCYSRFWLVFFLHLFSKPLQWRVSASSPCIFLIFHVLTCNIFPFCGSTLNRAMWAQVQLALDVFFILFFLTWFFFEFVVEISSDYCECKFIALCSFFWKWLAFLFCCTAFFSGGLCECKFTLHFLNLLFLPCTWCDFYL